jgi:Flp pilus assembly protein TadB
MAKRKRQTIQWPKERQTIQWPKEKDRQYKEQKKKTDNTMAKRKRQTIQWPKEKVYCLSFSFVHCIVCLFLLAIVLSVFLLATVLSVFFFWPLYYPSFFEIINSDYHLVSSNCKVIAQSNIPVKSLPSLFLVG